MAEHQHTNRLINETSPYLLQHAHNPVNWYAWGPDAFEAARAQNKPIFLSIGYSTCYWCHVMERESFEVEEVAALMNAHFISIKVDREERPDVDGIYMAAVQIQTRRGGWPMSVFLEPTKLKPFFGGTYFPKQQFMSLLTRVNEAWQTHKDEIFADAGRLADAVTQQLQSATRPLPLGQTQTQQAHSDLMGTYDRQNAGFGGASGNKFPMPVYLELLIAVGWDDPAAHGAILHTLDRMATGGMYDQIGGGFHRYSTDPKWLVPHFEKMIYDNGQLASVYAEAYERTGDPFYGEVLREVLDFVMREMTDPAGGFYSAQDAEVNTREGENYIWTAQEIRQALGEAGLGADIEFTLQTYGFSLGTNFRDPHHPEDGYKNVVYLIDRPDVIAQQMGIDVDAFDKRLEAVNAALLQVRDQRDQPGTDDKILAAWNGLMIAGMADGGRVLDAPGYVDAARAAAQFVLSTMRSADGGLLRTYRAGQAKIDAFSVDYAFMIRGLIALHRATGESQFVEEAVMLAAAARDRFWDYRLGAYFDTLPD
ncbi:MAG: thioredoxin domain-containing protein, partial [Phycisphaerales bacterium]